MLLPGSSSAFFWQGVALLSVEHDFKGKIAPFSKVRMTLVLGSGGHTAELLGLVGASYLSCEDCVKKHSFHLLECCFES